MAIIQKAKLHRLKVFYSRRDVNEYIKFQGWPTRQAKARMFKWPEHKLANKHGRVSVVKRDFGVSGWMYLFETGDWEYISQHGKTLYDWE